MSNFFSDASILVTGASGFIGNHLVKELVRQNAQVLGFSRTKIDDTDSVSKRFTQRLGDITNQVELGKAIDAFTDSVGRPLDYVFHLAGQKNAGTAKAHPHDTLTDASIGTLNVLECLRIRKPLTRFVLASSVAVYGRVGSLERSSFLETDACVADSIYSVSKINTENLCFGYHNDCALPLTVARLSNVYGPGQSLEAVIPAIIEKALRKDQSIATGNLTPVRDFIFVEDVVKALLALAQCSKADGKAVNVGTGLGTSIYDVLGIILKSLNYVGQVNSVQDQVRENEKSVIVPDTTLLRALTNWLPEHDMDAGLKKTIDHHIKLKGRYES